ncbi:acetyl-CoA carboxylase biotin carboxylase subunit [Massilibacteroides sp.]|uniref:acetyl-CoA carboxylase biotin carboxylase subunit n=1 Tax=Massilibacteroides sp. TaxID=2034766 RepID=UPI0026178379|nr:acetyl-CoA carboxylase biotin carboxylase subunit [Massilibacteroides sp.]MDD4516051.1 acetyl-CoA carboxylase biotin carboxylase subunit [Massilibacteroides sp.]
MIKKVLVANRGEIAVRIMRSCREMEIQTVAVFSEADRTSKHVLYADEACCIGPASSIESYLNIDAVIQAAKKHGADAIHPGYGFLSENEQFVRRCEKEGIIFIGPTAETMISMGDKIMARKQMIAAGVPVVPGTQDSISDLEEVRRICKEIGFPVMLKASMGGGGKGMRLINKEEEIREAYETARSEAFSSFGDDTVYIEKFVEEPHHIEFQILGDKHGNVIHLCERECSVQRRNQKIVEESPSVLMTPELRKEMGEKAVAAAKSVHYIGAGTIEFLVDKNRNFYFLEMNTRLQVEHPITEEVLGIDLVKEQIHVANGEPIRFKQSDIVQRGHAIECRICAEDTENNFMPSPGVIRQLMEPTGIGVRIDSNIYEGYEIPIYYDPMIGKLIVWATNRKYAIERMRRVLYEYRINGLKTNIGYLRRIMDVPDFVNGDYTTAFIAKNSDLLKQEENLDNEEVENIALIASYIDYLVNLEENKNDNPQDNRPISRWREFGLQKGVLRI